jgi:hypothetical protein
VANLIKIQDTKILHHITVLYIELVAKQRFAFPPSPMHLIPSVLTISVKNGVRKLYVSIHIYLINRI